MSLSFETLLPSDGVVSSPGVIDIRTKIQHCKDILAILHQSSSAINIDIDPNEQLARLNIWAANMGVFSEGRKSLAVRLHGDDEVGKLIVRLVSVLEIEIESFLAVSQNTLDDAGPEGGSDAIPDGNESSSGASSTSSYRLAVKKDEQEAATEQEPQLQAWLSIQTTITSLQQLGQIIRRAGAQHRMERVERFKSNEENRDTYETFFRFALQKADHLFPNASIALRRRVAESIATRRAHLSDLREHQSNLSTLYAPTAAKSQPDWGELVARPMPPPTDLQPRHQEDSTSGVMPQRQHLDLAPLTGSAMLPDTTNTRLDTFVARDAKSAMKSPESVISVKAPSGGLPPKPRIDHRVASFLCPYCCLIYPTSEIATEEGWRNHLIQDFEPYFCTQDDCTSPYSCANSFADWLGHMRDSHHGETRWRCWQCRPTSQTKATFPSLTDFEKHLTDSHPSEISKTTYSTLLKYSRVQTQGILPQGCPFCGGIPKDLTQLFEKHGRTLEVQNGLENHVRDHLVSIAYILAPIDMGQQDENHQIVDDRSDAQRDNSSARSEAVLAASNMTCDNSECDCNARSKDSEPASEEQDPAYRFDSDCSTEWQFWYPISLPPNFSRIGSPGRGGHSDDLELLTQLGLQTSSTANPSMTKAQRELHDATIQSLGRQALTWSQPEKFISDPSPGTYEWIWNQKSIDGSNETAPVTGFPEWLQAQESSPYYWITGRLGSGKSTLMRYILTHNNLDRHLSAWRPDVPPFVIALFANASRDTFQQSTHWILRGILGQALQQDSTLASVFLANSVHVSFKETLTPSNEIERALSVFLGYCRHGPRAILLLVDGLHELNASQRDLITLFTSMSHQGGSNIKICAASRSWPVFQDLFKDSPRLIMHDVVGADIEKHVTYKLEPDILPHYTNADLEYLRKTVSERATGIFLWAKLTTLTITNLAQKGSTLSEMKDAIFSLPKMMEDAYNVLASRVDDERLQYLSGTLLLKDAISGQRLHYKALAKVDSNTRLLGLGQADTRDKVANWLHATTMGLFDLLPNGYVDYMHPSVREWAADTIATSPQLWQRSSEFPSHGTSIRGFYELGYNQLNILAVSRNWRRHIMVNMTYHAARLANAPANFVLNSAAVDFTDKFRDYLEEAERDWTVEDGGVWLDPAGRSSTNLYEWAAALAMTEVFEYLGSDVWELLREKGDEILSLAIFGPPEERLEDWGMSTETYFDTEMTASRMFNSHRRQMIIFDLLDNGIIIRPRHLDEVLQFKDRVENWPGHDEVSQYLGDVIMSFLLPTLADPDLEGDYRRVPRRLQRYDLLIKSASQ